MAEIAPFRGLLYNSAKVGDMAKVMAPPYDVISPKMQDELYARHPNNVVKVILTKDEPGTDKYARAAAELKGWMGSGVMARDEAPAIYYYIQAYSQGGKTCRRKGFIALSRIEEFGKGIHAHEQTLSGPKADRLRLIQACNANTSCIFSLYSDPGLAINRLLDTTVERTPALIDVKDDNGVGNAMWRVTDADVIRKVATLMGSKALFIADGHHRYETALNYRNLMRQSNPDATGMEAYNYVMMYFSNMDDEGMTIWPTHRIIHSLPSFDRGAFLKGCADYFDVEEHPFDKGGEASARKAFLASLSNDAAKTIKIGAHVRGESVYRVLTLKSRDTMDKVFGSEIPDVFKNLDVTVLHALILQKMLGITKEAQSRQTNIVYVKSFEEALNPAAHEGQVVFLLNSTRIGQVKAVAEAGLVMPQKSTYFYPKLLTGLVLNLLDGKVEGAAARLG